jgi:alkylated DNA repair dioxygenase AlkB
MTRRGGSATGTGAGSGGGGWRLTGASEVVDACGAAREVDGREAAGRRAGVWAAGAAGGEASAGVPAGGSAGGATEVTGALVATGGGAAGCPRNRKTARPAAIAVSRRTPATIQGMACAFRGVAARGRTAGCGEISITGSATTGAGSAATGGAGAAAGAAITMSMGERGARLTEGPEAGAGAPIGRAEPVRIPFGDGLGLAGGSGATGRPGVTTRIAPWGIRPQVPWRWKGLLLSGVTHISLPPRRIEQTWPVVCRETDQIGRCYVRMPPMQASLFDDAPLAPKGFAYERDFISADEESDLARQFAGLPFKPFEFRGVLANRHVIYFGLRYDFAKGAIGEAEPIPPWLIPLRDRAAAFADLAPEALPHVLINAYAPGAAIGWHRDRPQFEDVVGVSLLAACPFRFRKRKADGGFERLTFTAEPRSIYRLRGPSRWDWEHSIPPVEAPRYSITFRSLRR